MDDYSQQKRFLLMAVVLFVVVFVSIYLLVTYVVNKIPGGGLPGM